MVPEVPSRSELKEQLLLCERLIVYDRQPRDYNCFLVEGADAEVLAKMLNLIYMALPVYRNAAGTVSVQAKTYKLRARIKNEGVITFKDFARVILPELQRLHTVYFYSATIFYPIDDSLLCPLCVRVARDR